MSIHPAAVCLAILVAVLPKPIPAQALLRPVFPKKVSCTPIQIEQASEAVAPNSPQLMVPFPTRPPKHPDANGLAPGNYLTVFQFVVDTTGRVDPCSIRIVSETDPDWTSRAVDGLLDARFDPAMVGRNRVRFSYRTSAQAKTPGWPDAIRRT